MRLRLAHIGVRIHSAALGFTHKNQHQDSGKDACQADVDEGVAPADGGVHLRAEGGAQRLAERNAEREQGQRKAALLGREVVRDDRVGGRGARSFANADADTRRKHLRIGVRHPAQRGEDAPEDRACAEDVLAAGTVCDRADNDAEDGVEESEVEPRHHPHLAVGETGVALDRLDQDRHQLPVEEVEYVDEAEKA